MFKGIMVNEDDTHFFYNRHREGQPTTLAEVEAFAEQYRGTQVTDFVMCVSGRMAVYPSQIREGFAGKYTQKKENGLDVDYTKMPVVAEVYDLFIRQGIDVYAVWTKRFREIGINPWASIRMNDCHDNDRPASFLHPDFFHNNKQLRRVTHREATSYFERNLDYEQPEVYDLMLRMVEEVAFRYDVYGIELDWQRENFCFQIGREYPGRAVINRFMRDTRAILNRAAEKWGHPLKLAARVIADPVQSAANGFNVLDWAKEGTVDLVAPSPRWRTTDTDMPIEFWKQMLAPYPVELAAGLEILLSPYRIPGGKIYTQTCETTRAQAAQYLAQGADKIYLFNYMDEFKAGDVKFEYHPTNPCREENYIPLLKQIGDTDVANLKRRHIVTFPDSAPVWSRSRNQLPVDLSGRNDYQFTRVAVGDVPAGAKVQLLLGVCRADGSAATDGDISVCLNSQPVTHAGAETLNPPYVDYPVLVYDVPNDGDMPPYLVVETSASEGALRLDYVEVRIN